uniref:Uncharacterized protein n=1 Tax=Sphaerodactylus townsendi TaxID=933632 RepID=A0ACB8ESY9_9SAUR
MYKNSQRRSILEATGIPYVPLQERLGMFSAEGRRQGGWRCRHCGVSIKQRGRGCTSLGNLLAAEGAQQSPLLPVISHLRRLGWREFSGKTQTLARAASCHFTWASNCRYFVPSGKGHWVAVDTSSELSPPL